MESSYYKDVHKCIIGWTIKSVECFHISDGCEINFYKAERKNFKSVKEGNKLDGNAPFAPGSREEIISKSGTFFNFQIQQSICPNDMFLAYCKFPDGREVFPFGGQCPEGSEPVCFCLYSCPHGEPDENCNCCEEQPCDDGYAFDINQCRCRCVRECPLGFYTDYAACICRQCTQRCPENHYHGPDCFCQCGLTSCHKGL